MRWRVAAGGAPSSFVARHSTARIRRVIPALACWLLVSAMPTRATPADPADIVAVDLVDNGRFDERYEGEDPVRRARIPWWRSVDRADAESPAPALDVVDEEGERWLVTRPGRAANQPIAAYAPLAGGIEIRGRVRGPGRVTVFAGNGRASFDVGDADEAFTITGNAIVEALGAPPLPRLVVQLEARGQPARWTSIEVLVPLPAVGAASLRAEIVERIDEIVALWTERAVEPTTGLLQHAFDAVTGERLFSTSGGVSPFWDELLDALAVEDRPDWRAAFERFVEGYFAHCLDTPTGLPARWPAGGTAPDLDAFVELHADLRFLLNLAERGSERFRERARRAAERMGAAVLEFGVLPDGTIAPLYRARDGAVSLNTVPLRRLDVPAQLARLGASTGDERYVDAARNMLAELEFTHRWPCTWDQIDPGFDDQLGLYGDRARVMLEARPEDPAFRSFLASGWTYYAPRWRDAVRFGGKVAADQVRCWRQILAYAELDPTWRPVATTVVPALRAHVKGEQYSNGAWGDVTYDGFDPKTEIEVGDLPGVPANLLEGIALAYDERLAIDPAELRALYAAVLRSTVAQYRRPYGYLTTQREVQGTNMALGGYRMLAGLVEMLERLSP